MNSNLFRPIDEVVAIFNRYGWVAYEYGGHVTPSEFLASIKKYEEMLKNPIESMPQFLQKTPEHIQDWEMRIHKTLRQMYLVRGAIGASKEV